LAAGLEYADNDLLTVDRGKRADTHIRPKLLYRLPNTSLLRDINSVSEKLGHDFEASHQVGRQFAVHGRHFLHDPIQAIANRDRPMRRLEMNIAGGSANGVFEHEIDEPRDALGADRLQSIHAALQIIGGSIGNSILGV
jgi:hypothetical protein